MPSTDPEDLTFAAYRRCRDEATLQELMHKHLPAMRAIVRRVLHRCDLAEDAIQEAFVQLCRKSDTVRGPLGPWLRRVTLHAALNLLRVETNQRRHGHFYEEARQSTERPAGLDVEVKRLIGECIANLPEHHRSVIARGFFLCMTQREIAAEDQITQVAVHKRMRLALAALRWEILRCGLGDCLGAFGQPQEKRLQASTLPMDPYSLSICALFCLPSMIHLAGQAGTCAGIAAAAWAETCQTTWSRQQPSRS